MPIFVYKGYDLATGNSKKGRLDADSIKGAKAKLKKSMNIVVTDIKESLVNETGKGSSFQINFNTGVSLQDVSIMTRQFATLQGAHVPIDECLKALKGQVDNKTLQNVLSNVSAKVSEGQSLADALSAYPKVFGRLYINMIRAGESSGKLDIVLDRLAGFLENQAETQGNIIAALTYPLLMILASVAIVGFLFVFIVPKLTKVFDSLKVTLPWYTKMCIAISEFLQNRWYVVFIVIAAVVVLFMRWVKTEKGRADWDEFVLKVPLFGGIIMRIMISRMTKTLATLLNSGVPILQSLEITKNVITNTVIANVIEEAKIAVREGKSLGRTIEQSGKFPTLVTHMIKTGERTGELETMLEHVAVAYEVEAKRKIESMISLIEPIMIIVMGLFVVLIVLSLMVPMLSVMNQVR
jgi:general secretion pathway protein F